MRLDGTKLKIAMAEHSMKVRDLSEVTGLTATTISKARSEKEVSGETAVKIAFALSMKAADLLKAEQRK